MLLHLWFMPAFPVTPPMHVTVAIPDAEFSAVQFCSYVSRTSYALRSAFWATAALFCFYMYLFFLYCT